MSAKQPASSLSNAGVWRKHRDFLTVCALLLVAFLLRLPALEARPLWYDEAFSVLFAKTGLRAMIRGTLGVSSGAAADVHPLFYYTLLSTWMRLFGSGVMTVRMLSVVISLLTLVVVWKMMHEMFGYEAALFSGVLFALSPFQIQYGQEARMYGLMNLWILLCAWLAWRGTLNPGLLNWVAFGVSAACAMYTHALSVVFLVPLALTPFFLRRSDRWWRMALASLFALALYLPWGISLPDQLRKVSSGYWISRPDVATLVQTAIGFITGLPLAGIALVVGLFLSVGIYAFSILQAVRLHQAKAIRLVEPGWLLFLILAPVLLLFAISWWRPVYLLRIVLPSGAILLLGLAWLWSRPGAARGSRIFILITFLGAFMAGYTAHLNYQGFPYAPFDQVGGYIRQRWQTGDLVLHANKISMLPEAYYAPDLDQHYLADPEGSGSDTLALETQQVLGVIADHDVAEAVGQSTRVYFLVFEQELQDYADLGQPVHPVLAWLQTHHQQQEIIPWGDLRMYIFEGPPVSQSEHPPWESRTG